MCIRVLRLCAVAGERLMAPRQHVLCQAQAQAGRLLQAFLLHEIHHLFRPAAEVRDEGEDAAKVRVHAVAQRLRQGDMRR